MSVANRIVGLGIVILALAVPGCEHWGEQGKTTEQLTNKQKQKRLLRQIDRNYADADAHRKLADLYLKMDKLQEAQYEYKVALSYDPVNFAAQAGMVKAQQEMGRKSRAENTADVYFNEISNSTQKLLELGQAFEKHKLDQYALRCYKRAMRIDKDSPEVFKRLGFFYLKKGDKSHAEEYFRRSFNLDPYQHDVAYELGKLGVVVDIPEE